MLAEGTLIDNRYRVVGPLGSGGMADVYLAEDSHLGRRVAVKVMHDRFAQDPQFVSRFEREASAAAGLQHKNVVGVYDRGAFGNTRYIVMEYIDGRTLKDIIKSQGPMAPLQAIAIAEQVLAAAGFAHQRGIIHRDLKPQNVLVDREGNAKVADFGIAHEGTSDVTQAGVMLGTAQYVSPEQAQGQPPQAASDLYSVGVMLFEMLTGQVPFAGDSSMAIALKHVNEQPPAPSQVNPSSPQALDAVVLYALNKDPATRFRSAGEFVAALEHAKAVITGKAPPTAQTVVAAPQQPAAGAPAEDQESARRRKRRRIVWSCVATLVVLFGLLSTYLLTLPDQVTVPYVIGRTVDDAQAKLKAAGLESEIVRRRDVAPAGEVVAQDPTRGEEVDEGSTVLLTVSSGPGTVKVPKVRGLPENRAIRELRELGLTPKVQREFSKDIDKGQAIRTVPPAGDQAERGSSIDLFISKGAREITVPDVTGLSKSAARRELEEAGFEVDFETENSEQPEDEAIDQSPSGGSKADEGSTVVVTLASGSNEIPDVTGLSEDDATQELEEAGFDVTVDTTDVDEESEDGIVQSQNPGGGSVRKVGLEVTIVVGEFTP
jgi:serine/threonine-protein kinase